ncbi:hypothetical protein Ddc_12820 [Ditylenchus destructor]|nr:hypothetical protein Ddc_12820 [Ditylenchus destructor]
MNYDSPLLLPQSRPLSLPLRYSLFRCKNNHNCFNPTRSQPGGSLASSLPKDELMMTTMDHHSSFCCTKVQELSSSRSFAKRRRAVHEPCLL